MKAGIVVLVLGYVLSQFYRAFLAVLTPDLGADLGATPEDLATASGTWFLVFAAMQIPVGAMLDAIGPRRTAAALFAVGGGGGAALFAIATAPWHITVAMGLIGIGCSPVLMASYFIFARVYPAAVFATLAGVLVGVGSLGNIASAAPLAAAVEAFGWRQSVLGLAVITLAIAVLIGVLVKDPPKVEGGEGGSVLTLLAMPALWPIYLMMLANYAPAAGIRGLWAGPFAADTFGADGATIGTMTLVMGLAMIAGSFAYGPMDRLLGTRKWVILAGNLIGALCCGGLVLFGADGIWIATALFAGVGFFCASFPLLISHGRSFLPPHLTGRGVTLLNLFGIGGAGLGQMATGRLFTAAEAIGSTPAAYEVVFAFFGAALFVACLGYLFSRDRTD